MSKRIALLKNGQVFNVVIGDSTDTIEQLFECQAIEVTDTTLPAHIGYGFSGGTFEQPPPVPEPEPDPNEVLTTPES